MNQFTHKGYGRIYVEQVDDILKVENVIEQLDAFERGYLPPGMIALFSEYPNVVYTHKFSDLDIDMLTAVCWDRGIKIWCFDSGYDEYPKNLLKRDIEIK